MFNFLQISILIVFTFLLIKSDAINVMKIKNDKIYLHEEDHKVLLRESFFEYTININLDKYFEIKNFLPCASNLTILCDEMKKKSLTNISFCDQELNRIINRYHDLHNDFIALTKNAKQKRDIQDDFLNDQRKDQLNIMQSVDNATKYAFYEIQNATHLSISRENLKNYINLIINYFTVILNDYEDRLKYIQSIMDGERNQYRKIGMDFHKNFPREQLKRLLYANININEYNVPKEIFDNKDNFDKFVQYKFFGNQNTLNIIVQYPSVEAISYNVIRLLPIPYKINNKAEILKTSKYILISENSTYVIPFNDENKNNCKQMRDKNLKICGGSDRDGDDKFEQSTNVRFSCELCIFLNQSFDTICSTEKYNSHDEPKNLGNGKFFIASHEPFKLRTNCTNGRNHSEEHIGAVILTWTTGCRHYFRNYEIPEPMDFISDKREIDIGQKKHLEDNEDAANRVNESLGYKIIDFIHYTGDKIHDMIHALKVLPMPQQIMISIVAVIVIIITVIIARYLFKFCGFNFCNCNKTEPKTIPKFDPFVHSYDKLITSQFNNLANIKLEDEFIAKSFGN